MYRTARYLVALALLFVVVVPPGAAQALDRSGDQAQAPAEPSAGAGLADGVIPLVGAPTAPTGFEPFDAPPALVTEGPSPAERPSGMDEALVVWGVWMLAFGGFLVYQIAKGPDFDDEDSLDASRSLSVQL